jgi:ABC-2 type transport system permease protein
MNWWRHVVLLELRKILAYRSDFWVTFLGQTFVQLIIARALWQSIFDSQNTQEMQGYTLPVMTLYYLIVPIGTRMLTGENIGFISREIYDGTFSRYLIYPLSVFQYKSLTYLTHSLFYSLQLILIYTLFHLLYFQTGVSLIQIGHLLLGTGIFFVASFAYVMLATMVELIALWADNIWSLLVMLRFFTSFFGGGFIPLTFFPDWGVQILKYTPFPYFVSLPVRTILGLTQWAEIIEGVAILVVWTVIFRTGVFLFWRRGEKHYTGVGI